MGVGAHQEDRQGRTDPSRALPREHMWSVQDDILASGDEAVDLECPLTRGQTRKSEESRDANEGTREVGTRSRRPVHAQN